MPTESLHEALNLGCDHVLRHLSHIIVADLNHGFGLSKRAQDDRVVEDVLEFLISDRPD